MSECDFCSDPNVVRNYDCRDFESASQDAGFVYYDQKANELISVALDSINHWAACEKCAACVDADDIHGLHARAIKVFYLPGEPGRALSAHLWHTYELFFQNRIRVKA